MNALALVHDWVPGRASVRARHDEAVLPEPQHVPGEQARPVPSYDGIDAMLADSRARLERVSARAAFQEALSLGALLVDIRPAAQRAAEGEIADWLGVLVIERNVLEWRLDPRSDASIPQAALDRRVIVLCQEGYTSSLAADSLQRLGILGATDMVGGFAAWRAAGMPVREAAGSAA